MLEDEGQANERSPVSPKATPAFKLGLNKNLPKNLYSTAKGDNILSRYQLHKDN